MPSTKFTEDQQEYIQNNYSKIGASNIAKELKVEVWRVYNFAQGKKIQSKLPTAKAKVIHEYFNVNELENWVA